MAEGPAFKCTWWWLIPPAHGALIVWAQPVAARLQLPRELQQQPRRPAPASVARPPCPWRASHCQLGPPRTAPRTWPPPATGETTRRPLTAHPPVVPARPVQRVLWDRVIPSPCRPRRAAPDEAQNGPPPTRPRSRRRRHRPWPSCGARPRNPCRVWRSRQDR